MNTRRKVQLSILALSLILMTISLIFNEGSGWKYWVGPTSMALVAMSQVVGLRHDAAK